jgi:phosphatidylglycerol:prolipoprotein diacylglycerol transferase
MYPLVNIFGRKLSTYGIMSLIGILVCGFFVCRTAKKRGHDDNDYIVFMLICSIGVFIGGHIVYGITNARLIWLWLTNWGQFSSSFDEFINNFAFVFGGSVFYGGLFGGMVAGIIWGKIKKLDIIEFSDICAPMVPLFHCFGRIGCFFGGCCYGIESIFGFTAHNNTLNPSINDVQRFPVQLLEALLNLILFFILWKFLRDDKFKGKLFAIYLASYSVIRFFDEFLRGDSYRGYLFGLSTSQIISILAFIGAIIYILISNKKSKQPSVKVGEYQT